MKKLILTTALCSLAFPVQAVIPENDEIVFEIIRNGSPFGTHTLTFDESSDKTRVLIDIDMKYKLGPVTVFRYEHSNEEVWKDNKPVAISSQTNDDGKSYNVQASWGDALNVSVNGKSYEAPLAPYTTSYWNPAALKADKLLNTQKGKLEEIDVTYKGEENIEAAGQTVLADRYNVQTTVPIDVWYDTKTKQWVGMRFKIRGSDFEYRRLTPVQ